MSEQPLGDQDLVEAEPESSTKKKRKQPDKVEEPTKPDPFTRKQPKKPVSTRRSAIAKLKNLNSKVKEAAEESADVTLRNYKLMRAASPAVRSGILPDKEKEESRKFILQLTEDAEQVKRQRLEYAKLAGPKLTGESNLTESGKKENVADAFTGYTGKDGRKFEFPYGNRRGKASTNRNEVGVLNPAFKVGEQSLQMLGHLSQLFMNKVSDYEYESMLVNDRVFVASNAQAKIARFANKTLQDFLADAAQKVVAEANAKSADSRAYRIGALGEALKLDPASTADLTPQQEAGAALLGEYDFGHHVDHAVRREVMSFLGLLQHQARNALVMTGPSAPATAKDQITGSPQYSVHLVHPSEKSGWHAEQALVMTLIEAGWTGGAAVSGTKQPCFCCWLTLSLLPQCGYPLTYNFQPGFIWDTTTVTGLTKVAKALRIGTVSQLLKMFDTTKHLTGGRFKQFMTALETQNDLTVDVTIGGTKLTKRHLTQDQSRRSFIFPRDEEDLSGAPFDDEPPASPYGYYDSPPSSPSIAQEKMEFDSYEKEMAEFNAEKEDHQKKEDEYQRKQKEYELYEQAMKEFDEDD